MLPLQDRDESDSDSYSDIPNNPTSEDSGWNDTIELDEYIKNKNDRKIVAQIIRKANTHVKLSTLIFKFKIEWIQSYAPSGWTHKSRCPFPDHADHGPSFGFNSKDDRFKCFGCDRSGGSVQFLAALHNRPEYEVARELLANSKLTEAVIIDLEDKDTTKSDEMLLNFSKSIYAFLQSRKEDPKALEHVEKVTWNLDIYLQKHAMEGSIDVESLSVRLQKLDERLKEFGG